MKNKEHYGGNPLPSNKTFWRYRELWNYLYKNSKLIRCTDGQVIARGKKAERLAKVFEKVLVR